MRNKRCVAALLSVVLASISPGPVHALGRVLDEITCNRNLCGSRDATASTYGGGGFTIPVSDALTIDAGATMRLSGPSEINGRLIVGASNDSGSLIVLERLDNRAARRNRRYFEVRGPPDNWSMRYNGVGNGSETFVASGIFFDRPAGTVLSSALIMSTGRVSNFCGATLENRAGAVILSPGTVSGGGGTVFDNALIVFPPVSFTCLHQA